MSIEIGEEQGGIHIQGYFQFAKKRTTRAKAMSIMGMTNTHFEIAKGNAESNLIYVTKDATKSHYKHYSSGVPSKQGTRSDMLQLRDLLKAGRTVDSLIIDDDQEERFGSLMRYARNLDRAQHAFMVPRTARPETYWFSGDSGAGKSFDAQQLVGKEPGPDGKPQTCYYKSGNDRWWPGYNGQDVVIWNDIRGGKGVDFTFLLRLMDTGVIHCESKGGYDVRFAVPSLCSHLNQFHGFSNPTPGLHLRHIPFRSSKIIFTCPFTPECFVGKYYPDERERQLVRRLDYIARYSGEYELKNVLIQNIKGGFYL